MTERVPERVMDKIAFILVIFLSWFIFLLSALLGYQVGGVIDAAKAEEPPVTTVELQVIVGDKERPAIRGVLVVDQEVAEIFTSEPKVWKLLVEVLDE